MKTFVIALDVDGFVLCKVFGAAKPTLGVVSRLNPDVRSPGKSQVARSRVTQILASWQDAAVRSCPGLSEGLGVQLCEGWVELAQNKTA